MISTGSTDKYSGAGDPIFRDWVRVMISIGNKQIVGFKHSPTEKVILSEYAPAEISNLTAEERDAWIPFEAEKLRMEKEKIAKKNELKMQEIETGLSGESNTNMVDDLPFPTLLVKKGQLVVKKSPPVLAKPQFPSPSISRFRFEN